MAWILDNIDSLTFLMAVLSFLYSICDFIVTRVKSKESYKIAAVDYANRGDDVMQFLVSITNRSDEPLTITEVSVFGTTCELTGKAICGKPESWNFQHTPDFPICIDAHSCSYAYLEFVKQGIGQNQLDHGTSVIFQIRSTRRQGQKTVTLGHKSHYLHSRERFPNPQFQPQEKDARCNS